VFQDEARRAKFRAGYYFPALDYGNLAKTIGAVLDHIGTRQDVTGKVGATGYCMGGNAAFRSATIFGNRLAAVASFHPGGLVTEEPESPHLRARTIRARLYLGPSIQDLTPETEAKLRAELDAGGARYEIDHYQASHGFAVPDSPKFDAAASEKHYQALARVFGEGLKP
jgi:carboxymethylenebutenolidase